MKKCGRCGAEINGNKCSEMELMPKSHHDIVEYRWMLLCEKCSAGLVQWLASGDPDTSKNQQRGGKMKTLMLSLKRQWFEKIKSGEKKEEYRECSEK